MQNFARILCVDDDPDLLRSLTAQLHRRYAVVSAASGAEGLDRLAEYPDIVVVVSDKQMPEMDGVAFLSRVRSLAPDITRILLTGEADLETAIDAVNEGQIFRFLTKPLPVLTLLTSIDDAVAQHRLITAERVLLEQTLRGSIHALTEALSLTSPMSFGRTTRTGELVARLVAELGDELPWELEVAAMLSQLACITLPAETIASMYHGQSLTPDERGMVARMPAVTERLLGSIPRLEVVREILRASHLPARQPGPLESPAARLAAWGAAILRIALDYDLLESQGSAPAVAVDLMHGREGIYDERVLAALPRVTGVDGETEELQELTPAALRAGMIFLDDVALNTGLLLVCHGSVVTPGLIERFANAMPGTIPERIRVRIPRLPGPPGVADID
ncbi:MAG TPA: HD domain-containing phosphohydrolase [Gemmatimonadales bacterium]